MHARRGERANYRPIHGAPGLPLIPGDPISLAHVYVDHFGLSELYVADLDAILGGALQEQTIAQLTSIAPVWLDAGVSSAAGVEPHNALGVYRVIVGLETLRSFQSIAALSAAVGGSRLAFSLDLRNGEPLGSSIGGGLSIEAIVDAVAEARVRTIIVLDLARVGTLAGPDVALVSRVRSRCPTLDVIAGGGVRGRDDLLRLADIGCDGVLVATALIDGRLGVGDVMAAREHGVVRRPSQG